MLTILIRRDLPTLYIFAPVPLWKRHLHPPDSSSERRAGWSKMPSTPIGSNKRKKLVPRHASTPRPAAAARGHQGVGRAGGDTPRSAKGTARHRSLWPQVPPSSFCACSLLGTRSSSCLGPPCGPHVEPRHPAPLAHGSTAQPGVTSTSSSASPADTPKPAHHAAQPLSQGSGLKGNTYCLRFGCPCSSCRPGKHKKKVL